MQFKLEEYKKSRLVTVAMVTEKIGFSVRIRDSVFKLERESHSKRSDHSQRPPLVPINMKLFVCGGERRIDGKVREVPDFFSVGYSGKCELLK